MKKKVKLFTHTDADGMGCYLVLLEENVMTYQDLEYNNVEFLDYSNVEERINKYLDNKEYLQYDETYITDLSLSKELSNKINQIADISNVFKWVDHHKSSLYAKDYDWAYIKTHVGGDTSTVRGISATLLLYEDIFKEIGSHTLFNCINDWDTWQWEGSIIEDLIKDIIDLFFILGYREFIKMYVYYDNNMQEMLHSEETRALLRIYRRDKKEYINRKLNSGFVTEIEGLKVFVVFSDKLASELGHAICNKNKEIDIAMIVNTDNMTVSYRTIKPNIDCSEFASKFFGGGHKAASGSQFTIELRNKLYKTLADNLKDYSKK